MTEWIPVEDRKPDVSGFYNVLLRNLSPHVIYFMKENDSLHQWNCENANEVITHWAPLPEMPKKKRWEPKEDEKYFFISSDYDKIECRLWVNKGVYWNDECKRSFLGVYKTKEEAELIRDKIKKFVESEIGEA